VIFALDLGGIALTVTAFSGLLLGVLSFLNSRRSENRATSVAQVETRLKETDQGIEAMSRALDRVERQLEASEARCDEEMDHLRAEYAIRISNLEEQVSKYRHDAGNCRAGLTAAQAIIEQMDIRIQELGGRPLGKAPNRD
jgi:chromosome segregation ATPase